MMYANPLLIVQAVYFTFKVNLYVTVLGGFLKKKFCHVCSIGPLFLTFFFSYILQRKFYIILHIVDTDTEAQLTFFVREGAKYYFVMVWGAPCLEYFKKLKSFNDV